MKKILPVTLVLLLVACNGTENQTTQKVASESISPTPKTASSASSPMSIETMSRALQTNSSTVKDQYLNMCVSAALQNRPHDEPSVKAAAQICECAYDEGVKAYDNNTNEFDKAVKESFDHPDKIDQKLLDVSDKTITACMQKFSAEKQKAQP